MVEKTPSRNENIIRSRIDLSIGLRSIKAKR